MNRIKRKEEPYYEVSQMLAQGIKSGIDTHHSRRFFYGIYDMKAQRVVYWGYDQTTKEEILFYVKRFAVQWCENGDYQAEY
ncbi:hypothetical protein M2145_001070 [Lachnospiraceae bacterium PF1-21]|uniref:Uncharacterized protein n=1 Tax=Ohessyouella blattaphilus TaxID=2949333 RepID=A0ABT1EP49_9FIRM|nr:hypothetical protein [Ohessyouella blattaphilus]MCP1111481.1 hypothetical protein [Ohessyouella blattaphilus]MCR8564875.1 hypothetical protein [Ohessyouella blattaphilus]